MEQNHVPFHQSGLSGAVTLKMESGKTLDDFCAAHVANYNPDRLEAIAMRFFLGKEFILTIYALDRDAQEKTSHDPGRLPVKKFKLEGVSIESLYTYFSEVNFTVSTGNYNLEDMEVVNK